MKVKTYNLADYYSFLGENGNSPTLTAYIPDDVLISTENRNKKTGILVCPGGGYCGCSLRESEPIALQFVPDGYNAFVITYSVAPNRFPTQLIEVAAAMDFMHKNAEEFGLDVEKIAIIGFSAGGHLAAHYSNCFDIPEVRKYFPNSYPVNASILCYPVITTAEPTSHTESFENLLGRKPTEEDYWKFSGENCVSEKTPPTFLFHTAADEMVPVNNSVLYAASLSKFNIPFELHIFPEGQHGLATVCHTTCLPLSESIRRSKIWIPLVKEWLKTIFNIVD